MLENLCVNHQNISHKHMKRKCYHKKYLTTTPLVRDCLLICDDIMINFHGNPIVKFDEMS
jgi:hypothetical protein